MKGIKEVVLALTLSAVSSEAIGAKAISTELESGGGEDVVDLARGAQGTKPYFGVDNWKPIILKKGRYVYGGEPGQTAFYTTGNVLKKYGNNAEQIFKSLQVMKKKGVGYRQGLTKYLVTEDVDVAVSRALANTKIGFGGSYQYFIPDYKKVLKPVVTVILEK